METKREIRKRILACRDCLTTQERTAYSEKIAAYLTGHEAFQSAGAVLFYADYGSEVETKGLLLQALLERKTVFAPRVLGEEMEFYRLDSVSELKKGYRGILEPVGEQDFSTWRKENSKKKLLLLMPGVAFDTKRHRIGYGKGYYDRYIGRHFADEKNTAENALLTVAALAYSCQIIEKIPWEPHDITPHMLVTERGMV